MPRHQRSVEREQFWRRHLARQHVSGSTIRDYCLRHGLSEPSFYAWRRTIAERDRPAAPVASAAPAFLPVAVLDTPARRDESPIEIRLGGDRSIRVRHGCDRALLAHVLALLQSQSAKEEPSC